MNLCKIMHLIKKDELITVSIKTFSFYDFFKFVYVKQFFKENLSTFYTRICDVCGLRFVFKSVLAVS